MGADKIWLISVLVIMATNILANPLLEGELSARTLFQKEMKCGTRSAYKRITMKNSIKYDSRSQSCDYNIRAYNLRICQVRIDFTSLDLDEPEPTGTLAYATCGRSRVEIDGMKFDLCGLLRDQHVYVPFNPTKLTDELKIHFDVRADSWAVWDMEINQIECNHRTGLVAYDARQAPDGCLQYYDEAGGRVESLNYYGRNYIGNTNYAICFNRAFNADAQLELSDIKFRMDSIDPNDPAVSFDEGCLDTDPAAAKDYIAIPFAEVTGIGPHSLFCGNILEGKDLTFAGSGPIVIHVNTDRIFDNPNDELGFSFRYRITNPK